MAYPGVPPGGGANKPAYDVSGRLAELYRSLFPTPPPGGFTPGQYTEGFGSGVPTQTDPAFQRRPPGPGGPSPLGTGTPPPSAGGNPAALGAALGPATGGGGAGGQFLSEAGPGMWKVDRLGQSPMYTNQMDVANSEAGQEGQYRAGIQRAMPRGPAELPDVPMETEISGSPTQTAPSLPSPSPTEGGEIQHQGRDWRAIASALAPALNNMQRGMSRPGSDRPYAQMGFDEETQQQESNAFAQQKLGAEQQQSQDRIAAMDREIAARRQMGQEEAAQRLEALREELKARAEQSKAELEARYGGTVSPELAAALGIPPGTSLREAELSGKVRESQSQAARDKAYSDYLGQQGQNLGTDNKLKALSDELASLGPMAQYTPEGQALIAEINKIRRGVVGLPAPPAVAPPPAAPPPPPQQPGLFSKIGQAGENAWNYMTSGGASDPNAPVQGQDQGQGGPMAAPPAPVGPPPLPPEVLQTIAPLPKQARNIVEGILRDHQDDPAGMRAALKQVIDKAPPEDRELVMKVLGPIVARF